ncbi:hypothetical protein AAG906_019310 [Vitis piasezkii]
MPVLALPSAPIIIKRGTLELICNGSKRPLVGLICDWSRRPRGHIPPPYSLNGQDSGLSGAAALGHPIPLLSFAADLTSRAAPSCSGSSDERSSSDSEKSRKANCLLAGSCMSGNVHVRLREKGEILSFSSTQGGADTPARITGDGYKNGGEVNSTRRHSGMDVDPSGRDNHSGPGRGGDHSQEPKRLS